MKRLITETEKAELEFVTNLTREQLLAYIKIITEAQARGTYETQLWMMKNQGMKPAPYVWERWFTKEFKKRCEE